MAEKSELRQRELDRQERTKLRRPMIAFSTKVVGVSFTPQYPDNLYELDLAQQQALEAGEPLVVVLRRDPDNAHDPNAIEVHVPALGEEWGFIGHLVAPVAARLAPQIDAGERWGGAVTSVKINPDHLDRPGIEIHCGPVHEED